VPQKHLSKKVCTAVRARRHASAAEKLQSCPLSPLCEEADVGASITIALHSFVGVLSYASLVLRLQKKYLAKCVAYECVEVFDFEGWPQVGVKICD